MLKDLTQGKFSLESNGPPDTILVPTPDAQGSHATTACSKQKTKQNKTETVFNELYFQMLGSQRPMKNTTATKIA